jgi:hypothetical protein
MTEPPPKISNRRANMIWPVRVSILSLQPWKHVLQFVDLRREGEAVSEIYTAITKGEKLCAEQIKRGATNHYRIELKPSLGQVPIKCEYDRMCFVHGIIITDTW